MTAFVASLLLKAEGQEQVKAALQSVSGEARRAGEAVTTSGRTGAQATRQLAAGAEEAARDMNTMAASAIRADAATEALGNTHRAAAGNVGNLVAQFNDIGIMLAAGQNPLQLAIQQGTQISQVIGPMGATGAVSALGSAFMGLLSPVNLITIGGIAAGAALVQSFMAAGDEALSLDDAVDELGASIDAYAGYIRTAAMDTAELSEEFGGFAGQIKDFSEYLAGVALGQSMDDLRASIDPLKGDLADVEQRLRDVALAEAALARAKQTAGTEFGNPEDVTRAREVLDGFRDSADAAAAKLGLTVEQASELSARLEALRAADGMADIATRAGEVLGYFREIVPAGQDLPGPLREAAIALEEMQRRAAEASTEIGNSEAQAQALLESLQQQAEMQALIAQYGEGSREVAEARVAAERAVFAEMLATEEISEAMKAQLMEAWEAANGIADTPLGAGIGAGADAAARMAEQFGISLALARQIVATQAAMGPRDPKIIYDPRDPRYDPERARIGRIQEEMESIRDEVRRTPISISSSGVGSGAGRGVGGAGGVASIRAETDAVARLIQRKEQELALARALDPMQREAIRNRELMATATEAERAKIEELNQALEDARAADALSEGVSQGLYDIITTAESAGDAIDMLKQKLIEAALQALLLGEGPLAGLFGTSGTSIGGMLFGGIFGGGGGGTGTLGLPLFAEGGMIWGAGGPREDRVPIYASPGEFMVNAQATARNRAVLEYINAGGTLGRFADGGIVGGNTAAVPVAASGISMPIHIDARGAQRGVGDEIADALVRAMPEMERRAVAAVARAQKQGRL